MYKYLKRLFDLIFALLLMPFLILILFIIYPLIKLEDGGPVFYFAKRLGLNGKVFTMFKIRTMKVNSPDIRNGDGSTFNSVNDDRLTKIGKVLRQTSIDEVPQILNVLLGHMSFIGPRPDLPEHIYVYNAHQREKLFARPGITGYNQAYFRNTIEWFERIENDIYYINNISFILDFKIVLATIRTVIAKEGIFADGGRKERKRKMGI